MIIETINKDMVEFKSLSDGIVFKDEHSNYCMKIEYNNGVNMTYLTDGQLGFVDDFKKVEKVRCKLVIDNA